MSSEDVVPAQDGELAAQQLVDRSVIEDLHYAFGQALDTNDWQLYRDCLDANIAVDYSQSAGLAVTTTSAEKWTAFVTQCVEAQDTVHYYSNVRIRFSGSVEATCRLNHQSHHRVDTRNGDSMNTQFGTYETTVVRRGGTWRLAAIVHRASWVTGNPSLIDTTRPEWIAAHDAVFGAS